MLRLFIIIFVSIVSLSSAQVVKEVNPNGYNIFYYDNGVVSSEGNLRDGKPDGYWKTYSEKGIIKSEGNRKFFQLDSSWKFYNETGKLAFEYTYKNGKKNGLTNTYDIQDGFIISSENFINDVKQGNSFEYYKPNNIVKKTDSNNVLGKTRLITPYVDGKKQGTAKEFSEDGTVITITEYGRGYVQRQEKINRKDKSGLKQGTWKEFYPSGKVKTEYNYLDEKFHGYIKEYEPNGNLKTASKYMYGELQVDVPELVKLDFKTQYYQGGGRYSVASFKDGVPEGIHKKFSPEGKTIETKVYSNGVLMGDGIVDTAGRYQGLWKEYYPNGNLKSKGEYVNSFKIGEWVYCFSNGKIEQVGTYDKKGKAQGEWKWFYPCADSSKLENGNLLRKENYRNNLLEGPMIEYSDSGKVITKGEYVENEKEGFWMLQLADYKEEGNYKMGKRDGEWKHYFISNGKLRFIGNFIDNVPDGKQIFYYPNGKARQVGKYAGGYREGEWKFYDETGFLFLTILYKSDIEIKFDGVKVIPETIQ